MIELIENLNFKSEYHSTSEYQDNSGNLEKLEHHSKIMIDQYDVEYDVIANSVSNAGFISAKVKHYKIRNGTEIISGGAFWNIDSLTQIELPEGLKTIESGAFSHCNSLVKINFPNGLEAIKGSAFEACTSLKDIVIPKSVTKIEGYAFNGCNGIETFKIDPNNKNYVYENGIVYSIDKTEVILAIESLIPPKVVLPDTVLKIHDGAFYNCFNLEEIEIPASVSLLGFDALLQCSNLIKISVDKRNENYYSENGVLFSKTNCLLIYPAKSNRNSYEVPLNIEKINQYAFANCSFIEKIKLPKNLTSIESGSFSCCINLMQINIPDRITKIPEFGFFMCRELKKIKLPKQIKSIDNYAFSMCENLKTINITENLERIFPNAFKDSLNLNFTENQKNLKFKIFDGKLYEIHKEEDDYGNEIIF